MSDHLLLSVEAHRDLRIRPQRSAALGDAVMTCMVVPDEFRRVQGDYPILFRRGQDRAGFAALALFGFEAGENLFLEGDRWDAGYLPLAMDIQPFLIGGAPDGTGEKKVVVDMASARIAEGEGVRVFDATGRPTPYLETVMERLGALDAGYQGAAEFFAALERHDLLEPFTLDIALDDGASHRLVGFHVVNEDRLRDLDADALGDLHRGGHLLPLFMAVASLARLPALIARRNRTIDGRG